jgi:branched-chain amino acid transport system substrate-binding protein
MSKNSNFSRRKVIGSMGAGMALGLAGCSGGGGGSDDSGPITVGVLAPLNLQQGEDIRDGAELAVSHINDDGGINDRDLQTVVKDTQADPATAQQAHRELILEENADFTTGIFGGAVMMNTLESVAEQETIHISNGAATNRLEETVRQDYEKYKYHFRTVQDSRGGAQNRLAFMEEQFGGDTVGILYEDFEWTQPFEEVWGGSDAFDIAVETRFSGDTEDFSSFYDEMESNGVDHCFAAMAFVGTNALTQWARQERDFTFGGNHNLMQQSNYWDTTDGNCHYGWTNTHYLPGVYFNDVTERFLTDFDAEYGRLPTYTGGTAYEAIDVWSYAANEVGTLNEDDVIPQMEQQSVDSAFGTIEFYPEGSDEVHNLVYEEGKTWDLMLQWQEADGGGEQVSVFYEPYTEAEFQTPDWI